MKKIFIVLYTAFLFILTFFSYLFIDSNLSYLETIYSGFIFSSRQETSAIYILLVVMFSLFYLQFLNKFKTKATVRDAKWIIGVTCAMLVFSYPAMLSFDIFNYIFTAKVLYFYHENPYIIMPIQFLGDPLLSFTHAANKVALYGPSWIAISAFPYILGFGNFLITLLNFKLLVAFFYLATSWVIYKLTKNVFPVLIFALNPLVAIETLVSGHNDIVMMFFALLGILMLSKKKIFIPFIFLIPAILIKYSTVFLLPVFLYVAYLQISKKPVNWEKIYILSFFLMLIPFFMAPLREEIYPWYAIWFLPFAAISYKRKYILYLSLIFSFSLLFRYVPFMLLGTHFDPTPAIKAYVTFVPVVLAFVFILIKEKLWLRNFSQ